jgi:Asp-tRNA(Asn)/Glu-tRNA(Gln) amidotransferase A subunit family amidase
LAVGSYAAIVVLDTEISALRLTWSVEDCAIMLQAIAGHEPMDPASADRPVADYRANLTGSIEGLRAGVNQPASSPSTKGYAAIGVSRRCQSCANW